MTSWRRFLAIIILFTGILSSTVADDTADSRQGRKFKKPLVFVTVTQVTTKVKTETSSTVGFCAKLVNVTGQCRRRRNDPSRWENPPVVLTFEDGMDDIDDLFKPSKVLNIEVTELGKAVSIKKGQVKDGIVSSDQHERIGSEVIQSTTNAPVSDDTNGDSRVFFHQVDQLLFKNPFKTITRAVLYTTTSTSYFYVETSTKTFYIQYCTPSPLSYTLCPSRRKR